ncbi:MAG: thiol peroxidase [Deltaproteobacteria bacterium]|jgi:thiol peroxidase|nr:thiol peroxidase [Deltaproteobacteria bacterium]
MEERKGIITFGGNPLTLLGPELKAGAQAPQFTLQANDLSTKKLSDYAGKVLIISVVPSLDTGICDLQTKRFNKEATALGDHVQILTVSCDLPFAQARWCGAAGVSNLETLSDHLNLNFGLAYGVAIKELRLLSRAVFVLDAGHKVVYTEVVQEVRSEVDFDAALAAVKKIA